MAYLLQPFFQAVFIVKQMKCAVVFLAEPDDVSGRNQAVVPAMNDFD